MRSMCALALAVVVLSASPALALDWMGVGWTEIAATLIVDSGNLVITPTGESYPDPGGPWTGAARWTAPDWFQAYTTPWVQASFLYPALELGASLMVDEATSLAEIGAYEPGWSWSGGSGFEAGWIDFASDPNGIIGYQSLGSTFTGLHTVKMGLRPNGTLDFWLNGLLVHSTTEVAPTYFGTIHLAAAVWPDSQLDSVTFTDFQFGGDYDYTGDTTVPEPGTLGLLLGLGVPGFVAWRRRRQTK